MIKLMITLMVLFLARQAVFPADETNKTPPAVQAATGEPGRAGTNEVAEDSPVADGLCLRDPFWPIGFFPASKPGGASDPAKLAGLKDGKKAAIQASDLSGMLRIGGVIKKGNKFYATINGFTVQDGEIISVVAEGEVYKFIVERIDFQKVQFRPVRK